MSNLRKRAWVIALIVFVLAVPRGNGRASGQANPPAPVEKIVVDANAPSHPFPHFWEQMFGSGRATLSLRSAYRRDLKQVKAATGMEFVRFHGILDDDTGFYSVNGQGKPDYNFSYIDQIYDGLLKEGVRPFVELSFMPSQLASTTQTQAFWYHPYVSPPKHWNLWAAMITEFARHLVDRYGIDEVSQWYFEVWNEPNIDFWAGEPKQATYFHLYDVTARALKSVSPQLRVGGPATAQAAWVSDFIRHGYENKVPVDFVSTHVYGNDSAKNVFGSSQRVSRRDMVAMAVKKAHDEVKASPMPDLPIIFSEYNASYMNEVDVTDSAFMGPWLASTISRCDGLVNMMSYWTFSDVFEEQGIQQTAFYGGFGLIAAGDIHKAAYNDFALLHKLGNQRLAVNSDFVIVTRRDDRSLAIALWNYAPPGASGPDKIFRLGFRNISGAHTAVEWVVDRDHGSPLSAWEAMGKPRFPSPGQLTILRQAGGMPAPSVVQLAPGQQDLLIRLAPHALALVEIVK
ncbi:MAG: glycosyl hydrolase family 39 [Acidobacteriota bacterium]|nr:glycosyl hydrolase family 39 [Acidobacteriota bacterium]